MCECFGFGERHRGLVPRLRKGREKAKRGVPCAVLPEPCSEIGKKHFLKGRRAMASAKMRIARSALDDGTHELRNIVGKGA